MERLLAGAWDDLGGDDGGMTADKLFSRMESVAWNPPILSFRIERHGGTVIGSTRAELQHWHVDVESKTATLIKSGRRQLQPPEKRFPMNKLVAEVVEAIRQGHGDDRLQWDGSGTVKIKVCELFPKGSACRMTLEGRRKRFRSLVTEMMVSEGWEQIGNDVFSRKEVDQHGRHR